ncbi:MAG: hypothetical protein LBC92_04070 [Rickettsiales bacterium]|jgi:hypothetical protein|nr:hypothetical protein [Rickettsiales bacterium]
MKLFFAKTFFKVGDVEYNYKKIISIYDEAIGGNCDILIFSELALTGMPNDITRDLIEQNNNFLEKIVNYTKDKKTKIIIGCLYFMDEYTDDDGIIRPSKLYNSFVFIADGYIECISSRTNILKNNLFNEYKYFDNEIVLKNLKYEADEYSVLIADDIYEKKNILLLKDRDSEFIMCFDRALAVDEKQLEKIAKWTKRGIIYMNAFTYNKYKFNGEFYILNGIGDIIHKNKIIAEDIIPVEIRLISGQCEIFVKQTTTKTDDFVNILARNHVGQKIIYEVDSEQKNKFEKNVKLISFKKQIKNSEFIDYKKYINLNTNLSHNLKEIIVKSLYKNCIYLLK